MSFGAEVRDFSNAFNSGLDSYAKLEEARAYRAKRKGAGNIWDKLYAKQTEGPGDSTTGDTTNTDTDTSGDSNGAITPAVTAPKVAPPTVQTAISPGTVAPPANVASTIQPTTPSLNTQGMQSGGPVMRRPPMQALPISYQAGGAVRQIPPYMRPMPAARPPTALPPARPRLALPVNRMGTGMAVTPAGNIARGYGFQDGGAISNVVPTFQEGGATDDNTDPDQTPNEAAADAAPPTPAPAPAPAQPAPAQPAPAAADDSDDSDYPPSRDPRGYPDASFLPDAGDDDVDDDGSTSLHRVLDGGIKYLSKLFGFDQAVPAGQSNDQGRAALLSGHLAADPASVHAAMDVVDPKHELPHAMRMIKTFKAGYDYYMTQGDQAKANAYAAQLIQYTAGVAEQYGQDALDYLNTGDTQAAAQSLVKAAAPLPTGTHAENPRVNKDGSVTVDEHNSETGRYVGTHTLSPQDLYAAAIGFKNKSLAWDRMLRAASNVKGADVPLPQATQDAIDDLRRQQQANQLGAKPGAAPTQAIPADAGPRAGDQGYQGPGADVGQGPGAAAAPPPSAPAAGATPPAATPPAATPPAAGATPPPAGAAAPVTPGGKPAEAVPTDTTTPPTTAAAPPPAPVSPKPASLTTVGSPDQKPTPPAAAAPPAKPAAPPAKQPPPGSYGNDNEEFPLSNKPRTKNSKGQLLWTGGQRDPNYAKPTTVPTQLPADTPQEVRDALKIIPAKYRAVTMAILYGEGSNLDPKAMGRGKNGGIVSGGLFQIENNTWAKLNGGKQIPIEDRGTDKDPRVNALANTQNYLKLLQQNERDLTKALRRPPTEAELTAAHQQGVGVFMRLYKAARDNPNQLATDAGVPYAAIKNNLNMDPDKITAQQALTRIKNYYGGSDNPVGKAPQAAAPVTPAGKPAAAAAPTPAKPPPQRGQTGPWDQPLQGATALERGFNVRGVSPEDLATAPKPPDQPKVYTVPPSTQSITDPRQRQAVLSQVKAMNDEEIKQYNAKRQGYLLDLKNWKENGGLGPKKPNYQQAGDIEGKVNDFMGDPQNPNAAFRSAWQVAGPDGKTLKDNWHELSLSEKNGVKDVMSDLMLRNGLSVRKSAEYANLLMNVGGASDYQRYTIHATPDGSAYRIRSNATGETFVVGRGMLGQIAAIRGSGVSRENYRAKQALEGSGESVGGKLLRGAAYGTGAYLTHKVGQLARGIESMGGALPTGSEASGLMTPPSG